MKYKLYTDAKALAGRRSGIFVVPRDRATFHTVFGAEDPYWSSGFGPAVLSIEWIGEATDKSASISLVSASHLASVPCDHTDLRIATVARRKNMSVADESVVEGLRVLTDESTGKRKVLLVLREATSDADLAQALARHPFITIIEVDVYERQRRIEWDALLRAISARENLEKVRLFDESVDGETAAPSTLAFLQAIQRNTFVRCVDLVWLHLPTGLSTFVDNAFSITSFSLLEDCDMELGVIRDLAAALQRNKNIKFLRLVFGRGLLVFYLAELGKQFLSEDSSNWRHSFI